MPINRGRLSEYFDGVAVKRLSAVEADALRSNQHEFNSSKQFKALLGEPQRTVYPTRLIWLGGEQDGLSVDVDLTWYQSRKPPRREHRLYFPTNPVSELAKEGDFLFVAKRTNGSLLAIIAPGEGTITNQLWWLFGVDQQLEFSSQSVGGNNDAELDFAARYILDELGIELEEKEADILDRLIATFGLKMPKTAVLSGLARTSLLDVDARDDPDEALLMWMEREEQLFRRLEKKIVGARIAQGFMADGEADVDGFVKYSLSVQNTRKSRVGHALENHIAAMLAANDVRFDRGKETESRNKPDFLFPGQSEYLDQTFPSERLTMLGSKSTAKDRWRQVLSEATRIEQKHLLTLQPAISENQTNEMRDKQLQLVVPARLHATYRQAQRAWLMSVSDFIRLVHTRDRSV